MKKTKLAALALSAVLTAAALGAMAGCGGPQEGQTTIRFWYTASISENKIMNEMIEAYNKGQGVEDGVYVKGDNRQNIERTALYVDTPDVLTVTDEDFKSWALEDLFTDLSDYYANDPGDYTEAGIPEAFTQTFRLDTEVGENGIRMAGEGADIQGLPFGANPMVYYYSLPAFENQKINIISCEEEEVVLKIFGKGDGECVLYEDDGVSLAYRTGEYSLTKIISHASETGAEIVVEPVQGKFSGMSGERKITAEHCGKTAEVVQKKNQKIRLVLK